MQDLVLTYVDENDIEKKKCYPRIFDFTDAVEENTESISILDGHSISACFFENPMNVQSFATVTELYQHCKAIIR